MTVSFDKNIHYGFMPGCSLSSYNPNAVNEMIRHLNKCLPNFSVILKCCGKPTKDIGQEKLFKKRFEGMKEDMSTVGIEKMILACPNCKKIFDANTEEENLSLYEVLPYIGLPDSLKGKGKDSDIVFTIHDPCSARYDTKMQEGVRWILNELGYKYVESEYSKEKTRCCGFGGQVETVNYKLVEKVRNRRLETLYDLPVVTYCSSCRSSLMQGGRNTWHILDLIFDDVVTKEMTSPEDVLVQPEKVWNNRFKVRKVINSTAFLK